ncbi:restriction modification system DNA specificity domain [Shewanella denitrificans OS217]|jgi:type I restriction enzyme, S subunit|uniref:Restriction modification system DNA specificity domain n=1 Tax=Shewanella denitrificans (strain OS217 / ATCC BAA-1090 / DSM 15013) TaxID=318161 RepID=Q12PV3_SHEDO|nr:restriction endonuclease subunit S [Shewanella denitrificans]ABE54523.1 restriction modification system DNA specificity domain [Shewanella denitrificans OS217]
MADLSTPTNDGQSEQAAESLITNHIDIWTTAIERKSSAGRGSSNKFSLYGIKKLRELILELAVRGKLVPQASFDEINSPDYEPASVLLERIAAVKAQLVKEGKLKKQKPLPEIGDNEKPFELPNGWKWSRLGDFVSIIRGITFPSSEKHRELAPSRVACIRTTNVQDSLEWDDLLYVDRSYVKREEQYLKLGDIVMSMANSRELVGKVSFITHIPVGESSFGGFLSVIRPYQFDASFLMSVLRAPLTKNELIGSASQTTNIANISLEKLNPLVIAVPPLEEQHRIVAKVDELMSLCDALEAQTEASIAAHQTLVETLLNALLLPNTSQPADSQSASLEPALNDSLIDNWERVAEHFDTLFTTAASIDTLKQTILQLAVMGKLVPQASLAERNSPDYEPAAKLLKRIKAEKAQLIKDGKIKKQKPLPDITDEEKPFELPESGEWVRLGDLCTLVTSGSRGWKTYYAESGATFIRSQDIKYDRVEFDDKAYVKLPETTEGKRTKVDVGNLLMTITGANVAKTAIVEIELDEAYVSQHVALIKLINSVMNKYIHLWLTGAFGGRGLLLECSYGAKPGLNLQNINELIIPIPPLEEQHRIVAKVEELMALCDKLKARLSDAQTTQLHLTDAIVEQAV